MSTGNYSPVTLVGRTCTFKDLQFQRQLETLSLPPDFPEELRSAVVTGFVEGVNFYIPAKGDIEISLCIDDQFYPIKDMLIISVEPRNATLDEEATDDDSGGGASA